jgi:hypothetical protein
MEKQLRKCLVGLFAALFLLTCSLESVHVAMAQEFRGTILGRVTDPLGAVIPGAAVTAVNEQTNASSKAITGSDGAYNIPFLNPGSYKLEVEVAGFRKYLQSGITINVSQKATINVKMEVGTLNETVTIQENASLVDQATGSLGQVVDNKKVEALPLNGRMIFMLNQIAAGVMWRVPNLGASGTSGLRPFDNNGGSDWSMNGGRPSTNEFLLDGAPDSTRGRFNFSPPVDAVQEFKVQTNTYDAQYGRTGGGVVNMTLKSGANSFHAQAWDFIRYGAWDANATLNNALGQPKPPHQYNQYGVTATGPVTKNKTFWMFTWEGLRERVPFPVTTSVPTASERTGDFTKSYTDQATPLVIYDPLTTRTVAGKLVRDQISCNGVLNVICPNRINPIAQKILNTIYSLPNIATQRLNNFLSPINKGKYNYNAELVRIDHTFSSKSKMFGTFYHNHRDEFRSNNGLQGTFGNQGQWPQTRNNYGFTLDWVYTLSPKSLLNFRVGFTRFLEQAFQTDVKKFDRAQLGFQNLPGKFLPRVDLEQYTGIGVGSEGPNVVDNTGSIQANFTQTLTRHTLKFGGEYRNIRSNPQTSGNSNGFFNFSRAFTRKDPNTADSTSGNSVASFLLGYPANANVGAASARALQWHYPVLFIQDDFRVTPRLTLNLGLRWDYEVGVTERYNRFVRGFGFNQTNPLADRVKNAPGVLECPACANLQGGLLFAGVNGVPRGLFNPDRNNFQPRFGFAYSPGWEHGWLKRLTGGPAMTSIRVGFGVYYLPTTQTGSQTGFFLDTPYIANDLNGKVGVPEIGVNTFSNPFPNGLASASGASAGLLTQVGQGLSFDNPDRVIPYIYQYNFSIQRELRHNILVDVAYVGSQTRHLSVSTGINEISAADLAKGATYLQTTVTNPFAGLLPGTGRNGATIQRQELLRPFPEFGGITENSLAVGKTWYNAFQMKIEKRFSRGLSFLSSYTWSKNMEQNNFLNSQDTVMVRQLTDYDRTHRWVLSGIYELPFGHGKPFVKSAHGVVNQLIGGWQTQWIFTAQSGVPLGAPDLERISSPKLASPTPDRYFNTCYRDTTGALKACLPGESPVWFQRAPFTLRTTANRLSEIRNPWKPILDMSVFKTFHFTERFKLEYRFETFNTLNSVIFAAPNTTFSSANFGQIVQPRGSVYFPRNVQMALKLYF